jgi:hypothetical protein
MRPAIANSARSAGSRSALRNTIGAQVTLARHKSPGLLVAGRWRTTPPIVFNVLGPIEVTLPGGSAELVDFGSPTPIELISDGHEAVLDAIVADSPRHSPTRR